MLNTYMRRIDLLCKLCAPVRPRATRHIFLADTVISQLFVSVLTTTLGYSIATACLLGMAVFSFATEFWWIKLVYKRFPILKTDEDERRSATHVSEIEVRTSTVTSAQGWRSWLRKEVDDWREFSRLPIFWSEFSSSSGIEPT